MLIIVTSLFAFKMTEMQMWLSLIRISVLACAVSGQPHSPTRLDDNTNAFKVLHQIRHLIWLL